jgi:hypothetical protein
VPLTLARVPVPVAGKRQPVEAQGVAADEIQLSFLFRLRTPPGEIGLVGVAAPEFADPGVIEAESLGGRIIWYGTVRTRILFCSKSLS